jgi:hypothetical protein
MQKFSSCPSLVVYNNEKFSDQDFKGICQTSVGGKEGRSNTIGQFGLGALTMFHFTEVLFPFFFLTLFWIMRLTMTSFPVSNRRIKCSCIVPEPIQRTPSDLQPRSSQTAFEPYKTVRHCIAPFFTSKSDGSSHCQGFTLITSYPSMDYLDSTLSAPLHTRVYVFFFDIQSRFCSNIWSKDHLHSAIAEFISPDGYI